MKIGPLLISALLLLASATHADTLRLVNGAEFEGKLIEKTRTHYVFDVVGLGVQRFRADQVAEVEESETVVDDFERRRKALGPTDANAHYLLGLWCEEQGLRKQASEMFKRTLELDPDHAELRRKLGHVRFQGEWRDPKEVARRLEERAEEVKSELIAVLERHRLGRSERLGEESVWYWPPKGWVSESDPRRPRIEYRGPAVEHVEFRLSVSALEVPPSEVREKIDRKRLREDGLTRAGEDEPVRAGPARGTIFGFQGWVKDTPVAEFHALLDHGDGALHLSLGGHGAKPIFLELMLSDVLDTVSFERPPEISEALYDFRMPGPDWVDAQELLSETREEMSGASGSDRVLLLVRLRLLGSLIGSLGEHDRAICRRADYSVIKLHAHRKLGMSTIPVKDGMESLLENREDADRSRVRELKVAGREALSVTIPDRDDTGALHLCMFGKGDVVYNVRAYGGDDDAGKAASLEAAYNAVLSSLRVP